MKRASVSIVGGDSLIGREVRDVLAESDLAVSLKLIGVDAEAVTLTEQEGEAAIMTRLDEDALRGSEVAFLAGSSDSSRKAIALAGASGGGPVFIDLTYCAEDNPQARLRAPSVEPPGFEAAEAPFHVIAHPAAIALAILLRSLAAACPIRRSLAHIFEPASERGRAGLDELQKQTVNLLSFKSLPKEVFDAQLGFNLLASYGFNAPQSLESVEQRIERHLASLLSIAGAGPLPSIRLVQAPVFHGYSISVHVEFERPQEPAALGRSLASAEVDVRGGDLEPPTNAGIAGQSGIAVGGIAADRNEPRACWFWLVADNLRLMADNGVSVARDLLWRKEADLAV